MDRNDQLRQPDQSDSAGSMAGYPAQRGFSLLEMLGALAIGALILVGLSAMISNSVDDVIGQQASYYQSQVVDAAKRYITDNAGTFTAGSSTAVPIDTLRTKNYLPTTFSLTNAFQQDTCVVVVATSGPNPIDPAGPAVIHLNSIVYTSGGKAIPEKDLPVVAANAGSGGGYIIAGSTNARGSAWTMDTGAFTGAQCAGVATPTDGSLVSSIFYGGPGDTADFLYRTDVPGHPELTQMNSPLRMANNALVAPNTSCKDSANNNTPGIAISDDATRALMTCSATGFWVPASLWREPVANYAALPTGTAIEGEVHITSDTGRAFAFLGGAWTPLAADQNGNFNAPGAVTAGTLTVAGVTNMQGDANVANNLTVGGTSDVAGNSHVGGDLTVDGTFTIQTLQVLGNSTFGGPAQFNGAVNAAQNVVIAGNVSAQNAAITNSVTALGMTASGYINGNSIQGTHLFAVGDACNIPDAATGAFDFPYGSIVINENDYNPMYCSRNTGTFQYIYNAS